MNEKDLKKVFDYQRFDPSDRLGKLIQETEKRYEQSLTDDDLGFVNAAGEAELADGQADEKEKKKSGNP